jgi:hypothetical protein
MNTRAVWFLIVGTCCGMARTAAAAEAPGASLRAWDDYQVILWVGDTAGKQPAKFARFVERMREMGVTTGMVHHDASPQPFLDARFPYYVENLINKGLCLKWNSNVRDWDAFVTQWARTGRPESAFVRDYSLDDTGWTGWAEAEARRIGARHAPHRPLAYNLRDELSVTISANPFDYDYSPQTLAGFRAWLRAAYRDLPVLNSEWQTSFASWDDVRPFSTDQIKHRMASGESIPRGKPDWHAVQALRFDPELARREPRRWNCAPWSDFRTYMDVSLARALGTLRAAVRAVDPATPVGIEGTQMPHAFGGYDLWRLSGVIDWVEPYDIGNAREIFGSFMPASPILSTVFETDTDHARRRLWHLLLEGDRGCILWWSEDCLDWSQDDLPLTAKARALAPVLREMVAPLAKLILKARRERDPVFIHYSQPSVQVNWLIESTVDGSTWPRRFSSFESEHNRMAKVRNAWLKALQDLGLSPQFLASEELERLGESGRRVCALVLPQSSAMSDREIRAVGEWQATKPAGLGPVLLRDGMAGLFDEHGRLRSSPPEFGGESAALGINELEASGGSSPKPQRWAEDLAGWPARRVGREPSAEFWRWLESTGLQAAAPVRVAPAERVRIHRLRLGPARILAFERNIDYQMSEELKQAGGNEHLERRGEITARLAAGEPGGHLYDLARGAYLGQIREWSFALDPWMPSLFVLLPDQVEPARLLEHLGRL